MFWLLFGLYPGLLALLFVDFLLEVHHDSSDQSQRLRWVDREEIDNFLLHNAVLRSAHAIFPFCFASIIHASMHAARGSTPGFHLSSLLYMLPIFSPSCAFLFIPFNVEKC